MTRRHKECRGAHGHGRNRCNRSCIDLHKCCAAEREYGSHSRNRTYRLALIHHEPTWRGPVAGGVLIYTHIGGYGFESRCARAFFLLAFGALGRKSQRAQKDELCAAALAEVASLGVGRGSLIVPDFF